MPFVLARRELSFDTSFAFGGGRDRQITTNALRAHNSVALSGFKNIEVIDMDTIDLSNLNRQFLFRYPAVETERWKDIRRFTDRPSAFAHPQFEAGLQNMEEIHKRRVLVVGAGGLGCEILKDLVCAMLHSGLLYFQALSGFKNIEVIDMDTIDLSNLNRQFLFRESDIGKSKAQVAAEFIEKRVAGCRVIAHNCKIQDKDVSFYRKFDIIICGLDSITARRWLNAVVCNLVEFDNGQPDFSTIVLMIDGGTEGFKGHSRIIIPYITPCVECTLDLYPPQVNFPLCTIAHTPRLPEHCVEYVKIILWEKEKPFGDEAIDGDNLKHVDWICEKAQERANEYGIQDVNHRLTLGVLKRIIPAVASTNAIIAELGVDEDSELVVADESLHKPITFRINYE
ncbi:thiF family domain-containing protein [Ditylenchus destructor]|uniref:NEDD8-activating enzyme E1 catalytic subunit n=1 Tax=Ditylenchus destructor TaxID=166010 RepID=A0AAD4R791_9BILA|nr:thiF family domain-containing protein [Ditylenchus destructor]